MGCVHVHPYPIERNWHDSRIGRYVDAKMAFSRSEHREEIKSCLSHKSEDRKLSNPRYIRVEAIVIVTIQG